MGGYDGGVLPRKVRLESVQLLELLPALRRLEDHHMGIGVTDYHLLFVTDGEVLEDVPAGGDGIGGFGGDGAVVDLLRGGGVTISLGMPVLPPPPPEK
jgi:hypothetical protein